MLKRFNTIIFAFVGFLTLGFCFYYIRSAFDSTPPEITINGMDNGGCYSGDIALSVTGKDSYKIDDISIWLDEKLIVNHYKINRSTFEYDFPINTQTLANGNHELKVIVQDASRKKNQSISQLSFCVDNLPLHAAFVKTQDLKVFQGHTLHVQFQVNKDIKQAHIETLSNKYPCVAEKAKSSIYDCYIPVHCDETPNEHLLRVEIVDKVGNKTILENKFHIVMYPFKKQSLAIGQEKLKDESEKGLPEAQLETAIQEITNKSPDKKLWNGVFDVPCDSKGISTDFGTLRTSQERGKYRHAALDLLGTPKSIIWASQDGIVALKDRYVHSGNTVIIDHGCGILSLYYHLDTIAPIQVGEKIKKGQPIGTLGKTGYASGYHLHWEMRNKNTQVMPSQWTKHDF